MLLIRAVRKMEAVKAEREKRRRRPPTQAVIVASVRPGEAASGPRMAGDGLAVDILFEGALSGFPRVSWFARLKRDEQDLGDVLESGTNRRLGRVRAWAKGTIDIELEADECVAAAGCAEPVESSGTD